jgi:hypothetical protein
VMPCACSQFQISTAKSTGTACSLFKTILATYLISP